MNSILIITLIAFMAFLLLTGFGIMRDFTRLWLKYSAKVFAGKQGVNYYSELATILVVVLIIAIAATIFKGAATILMAMVTTEDIATFTTALRGTFSSYTTELQSPKNHVLLFLLNPALKIFAVLTLMGGVRLFFTCINKKAGGDCFNEADVLYFTSLGVLFLIAVEILCHIQDIKIVNAFGNIAYTLLDKFSYILIFLTLEEVMMLSFSKDRLTEAIDKYLITARIERKTMLSGWKQLVLAYVLSLSMAMPSYLGFQFIRDNITLMTVFIVVLGIALLVMKKVFSDAWNLMGTVMFASALEMPIDDTPFSNKSRLLVIIGLFGIGGLLVVFGIAFPSQLFMLLLIMAVTVCLMAFGIVAIYFLTMGISSLIACITKKDTSTSSAEKSFTYMGWVLSSLPKAIAVSTVVVTLAFMAMTCFPKDLNCDNIYPNCSIVDTNGNWLYIDEEHDHYYTPVLYDELPEFFKRALVYQEDRCFFRQNELLPNTSNWHGVSLSVFRGRGGSNLNAQLVKNITYIDADGFPRDLSRKLSEMVSGYMVSQRETLEHIMELYVNIASFHGTFAGFRGLNAASLYSFGKPIGQLNLLQQLYLVNTLPRSMYIKTENRLIPYKSVHEGFEGEVKAVLLKKAERWLDDGLITRKEYNILKREELAFVNSGYKSDIPVSTRLMLEKYFKKRPGRIDCTLTIENEGALEAAYTLLKTKEVFKKNGSELQVAALVVEASNGKIIGHFSSSEVLDYVNEYTYPIGSLGKPAIILELLKSGAPLDFTLFDGKVHNRKTPHNSHGWSNRYVGLETILSKSLNAPFANIYDLGLNPRMVFMNLEKDYASMNISIDTVGPNDSYNYPLGLREMKVIDIAQIYQTIFNNGVFVPLSLAKNNDTVISNRVWDENHVEVVKSALCQTFESNGGTLHRYKNDLPGERTFYGKTGTSSRQKDFWSVLSDGEIVIVSWAAYGKQNQDAMELGTERSWGASAAGLFAVLVYNELVKTHNH